MKMTRKYKTMIALGSLLTGGLAVSHLVLAQPADHPGPQRGMMAGADANKDGKISKAEFNAASDARFARMDANRDGKLSKEDRELARQARLEQRFATIDTDKNGQISKAEFMTGHQRPDRGSGAKGGRDGERHWGRHGHGGHGKGMMMQGFHGRGDADKDGQVTREEFRAHAQTMFDKADANKDGSVTSEELAAARQAMRGAMQGRH